MTLFYGFILFLLFLFLILILFVNLSILQGFFSAAPWVPLSKKNLVNLIDSLEAEPQEIVYDLGSGDGRILISAVLKYDLKKAVGIEISWFFCFWSKLKIWLNGLKNRIFIKRGNFFKRDISEADIVICYLMPKCLGKLKDKFRKELKPGSKIFSVAFTIPNLKPEKIIKKEKCLPIYFYKIL